MNDYIKIYKMKCNKCGLEKYDTSRHIVCGCGCTLFEVLEEFWGGV